LIAIVAGVLALGACGGGDESASTTTVTRPKLVTTTVVVAPPGQLDDGDQTAAEAAVPRAADFPSGWESAPWQLGDQPFFSRAKGSCDYLHDVDRTDGLTGVAHSEVFQTPGGQAVAAKVQAYPTVNDATSAMGAFTRPDSAKCISSTVSAARTGPEGDNSPPVVLGTTAVTTPGVVAFFGTVDGGGPTIKLSVGYAAVLRGRALVLLTTAGAGSTPPDFATFLRPVIERLAPFA
jgi:hypothetical protein